MLVFPDKVAVPFAAKLEERPLGIIHPLLGAHRFEHLDRRRMPAQAGDEDVKSRPKQGFGEDSHFVRAARHAMKQECRRPAGVSFPVKQGITCLR